MAIDDQGDCFFIIGMQYIDKGVFKVATKKFVASKININENIWNGGPDKYIPLIPQAILKRKSIISGPWTWKFIDVGVTKSGIVCGNLTKIRRELRQVALDDRTGQHEIPNASFNATFMYDPKFEILLFEENSRVDRDTFLAKFAQLVYAGDPTIGDIVALTYPLQDDLFSRVLGYEVLTRIEFDIVPNNMIGKKELGDMLELIKGANGTKVKYAAENKNGLNKKGPYIESGVNFVLNAYGKVKSVGYDTFVSVLKNGKTTTKKIVKRFSSKDFVIHESVNITYNDPADGEQLEAELHSLHLKVLSIVLSEEKFDGSSGSGE